MGICTGQLHGEDVFILLKTRQIILETSKYISGHTSLKKYHAHTQASCASLCIAQ